MGVDELFRYITQGILFIYDNQRLLINNLKNSKKNLKKVVNQKEMIIIMIINSKELALLINRINRKRRRKDAAEICNY